LNNPYKTASTGSQSILQREKWIRGNHQNFHWRDVREWSHVAEFMVRTDVAILTNHLNVGESN
jgi:hypothetical protein